MKTSYTFCPLWCFVTLVFSSCVVFDAPLDGQTKSDGNGVDKGSDGQVAQGLCKGPIKINEVDGAFTGTDREFIEIVNTSSVVQPISGLLIADQAGTGPDIQEAVSIPSGVELAPGAFLYVVASVPNAATGLVEEQSGCIQGAPTPCLQVGWGIRPEGETVYLISRPPSPAVICEFHYPATVIPIDAWGRLPDGENTVGATVPSPGESNVSAQR